MNENINEKLALTADDQKDLTAATKFFQNSLEQLVNVNKLNPDKAGMYNIRKKLDTVVDGANNIAKFKVEKGQWAENWETDKKKSDRGVKFIVLFILKVSKSLNNKTKCIITDQGLLNLAWLLYDRIKKAGFLFFGRSSLDAKKIWNSAVKNDFYANEKDAKKKKEYYNNAKQFAKDTAKINDIEKLVEIFIHYVKGEIEDNKDEENSNKKTFTEKLNNANDLYTKIKKHGKLSSMTENFKKKYESAKLTNIPINYNADSFKEDCDTLDEKIKDLTSDLNALTSLQKEENKAHQKEKLNENKKKSEEDKKKQEESKQNWEAFSKTPEGINAIQECETYRDAALESILKTAGAEDVKGMCVGGDASPALSTLQSMKLSSPDIGSFKQLVDEKKDLIIKAILAGFKTQNEEYSNKYKAAVAEVEKLKENCVVNGINLGTIDNLGTVLKSKYTPPTLVDSCIVESPTNAYDKQIESVLNIKKLLQAELDAQENLKKPAIVSKNSGGTIKEKTEKQQENEKFTENLKEAVQTLATAIKGVKDTQTAEKAKSALEAVTGEIEKSKSAENWGKVSANNESGYSLLVKLLKIKENLDKIPAIFRSYMQSFGMKGFLSPISYGTDSGLYGIFADLDDNNFKKTFGFGDCFTKSQQNALKEKNITSWDQLKSNPATVVETLLAVLQTNDSAGTGMDDVAKKLREEILNVMVDTFGKQAKWTKKLNQKSKGKGKGSLSDTSNKLIILTNKMLENKPTPAFWNKDNLEKLSDLVKNRKQAESKADKDTYNSKLNSFVLTVKN